MLSKTLMLAAAVVAMSTVAVNAQSNSSNPTMAPTTGGAAKTESPGANAQVPGPAKKPDPSQSSSNPTEAPTTTGGIAKTEAPGANAQVPGPAKQPADPSQSSSTPSMAPTGTSK